jgi:hypothetical protein
MNERRSHACYAPVTEHPFRPEPWSLPDVALSDVSGGQAAHTLKKTFAGVRGHGA